MTEQTPQTEQERKLAAILVDALELEDVAPEEIDPEAPLFDPGNSNSLGLDSIDALEISLAIATHYKVQLKADDDNNKAIFYSLRSLSQHIETQST